MTIRQIEAELTWMAKEGLIKKPAYKSKVIWLRKLKKLKKLEAR